MSEHVNPQEALASGHKPLTLLYMLKFPFALFFAAITPVVVFIPLVAVPLSGAMLIDAISKSGINFESFLSSIFGGAFLAFYFSFYVPCLSFPCVAVFGTPAAIIADRFNLIRKWTCVLGGFLLASIPASLFFYTVNSGGSSFSNGVHYWINGVPTLAGLFRLVLETLLSGILGAVSGFSFWFVWQLFSRVQERSYS